MRLPFHQVSNFILFYIGWLLGVYYHNHWAALVCFGFALINFLMSREKKSVLVSALVITCIGLLNDSLVFGLGILRFTDTPEYWMTPWLAALWLLFASTYHSSLAWVEKTHRLFQATVGGIVGALSYIAGTKLGAVSYELTIMPQLIFHFLNWIWLYPLTLWLHGKYTMTHTSKCSN